MRVVRILAIVVLAASGVIPAGTAAAQSQPSLDALAGPLYQELAALKGIASPGPPPPILLKSRDETRRFIEQEMDRRYSAARVEQERKALVAWGLIPPDYDLRRLFVDLMQEQVAAYYDPRGKVMVVGDWLPPDQQRVALMHELVHALQDREVSLDRFMVPHPGQGDQVLARQALIEGEAVALTIELALKAQGATLASLPDLGPLRGLVTAASVGPTIGNAPRFLRDLLIFPYVDGLNFVHQASKRQPWSAMGALYRDPPRSTAQIMNPAKRLVTREDPIPIALPDVGSPGQGSRIVTEDELGEFALGAVLGMQLGEDAGRAAAAGWRGDRYRLWEDSGGRLMTAYLLAMENDRVATAFASAYARVLEKRYPALAGKGAPDQSGAVGWREGDRAFAVDRRGAEVLILEQLPADAVDRVREAVWRARPAARP